MNKYFQMDENSVICYVRTKIDFFKENANLHCKEISDGNINYVFRVEDIDTGESLIIKQARPTTRSTPDYRLTMDRNRIESEILAYQNTLIPGYVPFIYQYDPEMNCCILEDLKDYKIFRNELLEHRIYPKYADLISTYLAKNLILTSDIVLSSDKKKEKVKNYINPELCKISEKFVFTEPFFEQAMTNEIIEENRDFVDEHIYKDNDLKFNVAKLKVEFMNKAQSLLHGDLHTGSIFINKEHIKVFDPEFAYYGPAGYDIGNVFAHLIFAWINGAAIIQDKDKREEFMSWINNTIKDIWKLFYKKSKEFIIEGNKDPIIQGEFINFYIKDILQYAVGITGVELIRRIVGEAKVKDIISIDNKILRVNAERRIIIIGKKLIMHASNINSAAEIVDVIGNSAIEEENLNE